MLLDQLQQDLTHAVKERDQVRVDTLRYLLGQIMNFQIDKYPPSKGGSLTDQDILTIISKQVKSHKESIAMFGQGGRPDLVKREEAELTVLQTYLPTQMSEDEVRKIVAEINKSNPGADFGTLMKLAMAKLQGKADGALVAKILKES